MKRALVLSALLFMSYATPLYAKAIGARYNGGGKEVALVMAIDPSSGNVYVAGYSTVPGHMPPPDFLTVAYDRNLKRLWAAKYAGPGGSDMPNGIAIGPSGNVYVTGVSIGEGTGTDYATVAYDSKGTQLWVARYNGPGNGTDRATDIAVGPTGNVYVTGESEGISTSGYNTDYATIAYDSEGNQLWVARYDSLGDTNDYANAIAVDSSGNVYVTGGIGDRVQGQHDFADFGTVAYDPDGNQLWEAIYDGPKNLHDYGVAIVVHPSGKIYVAGNSSGYGISGYDYATIAYDVNGNQLWVARCGGHEVDDYDAVSAIAADPAGNVYVTGSSSDSGLPDYPPNSLVFATVAYDSSGNELWVARYHGFGPNGAQDKPTSIAVSPSGNIYVTGGIFVANSVAEKQWDYATVAYGPNGNQLWVARYDGPMGGDDFAGDIAIGPFGGLYVTGYSSSRGGSDFLTIKYQTTP